MQTGDESQAPILSVSELNQYAKGILEMHVGKVWVSGEVSNFSQPASGHWYFTLKDQGAQIRCAMFKGKNRFVRANVNNGQQILLQGSVSIYPGRGDYQLIADYIEDSGIGALQRQFEQLKTKLASEGLFEAQHKKTLPKNPQHIAVITSSTGAAVHDILSVLKERFPLLKISIIAASVQGHAATAELCKALFLAEHWNNCEDDAFDAIIIGRGGGSIEDLWAFNEEDVARAIFNCPIPVISAVGHETDTTIADYVADVRAPTPSAAAELISPDQENVFQQLDFMEQQLEQKILQILGQAQQCIYALQANIRHPGERLKNFKQRFQQLEQQLQYQQLKKHSEANHLLQKQQQRFAAQNPTAHIDQQKDKLAQLQQQLKQQLLHGLENHKHDLAHIAQMLDTVNPLATLQRGYAMVTKDDIILRQANDCNIGDSITAQLATGRLECEVKKIIKNF